MAQPDTRVETAQPPKRFAGWPPKLGQRANTTMVLDVYGRYRPDETERTAWERRAAEQDAERARSTG